uniref:Uncharacterized protein n=1 Tax=Tetranychus urticae TaxID=32264 RepID=T1KT59_TETUR
MIINKTSLHLFETAPGSNTGHGWAETFATTKSTFIPLQCLAECRGWLNVIYPPWPAPEPTPAETLNIKSPNVLRPIIDSLNEVTVKFTNVGYTIVSDTIIAP